ncbi:hypothetical protein VTG60DRAFT_925 [Thermothelomyces hinnuleus]
MCPGEAKPDVQADAGDSTAAALPPRLCLSHLGPLPAGARPRRPARAGIYAHRSHRHHSAPGQGDGLLAADRRDRGGEPQHRERVGARVVEVHGGRPVRRPRLAAAPLRAEPDERLLPPPGPALARHRAGAQAVEHVGPAPDAAQAPDPPGLRPRPPVRARPGRLPAAGRAVGRGPALRRLRRRVGAVPRP